MSILDRQSKKSVKPGAGFPSRPSPGRWKRRLALGVLLLGLLGLAGFWGIRGALHHVPREYQQLLQADPTAQRQASREFIKQAAALTSEAPKNRAWQATFTEAQINGWLAVDLQENHGSLLTDKGLYDPRIDLSPGQVTLVFKLETPQLRSVITLVSAPSFADADELELEIQSVHAGLLPVPLGKVKEILEQALANSQLTLAWEENAGQPTAVLRFSGLKAERDGTATRIHLEQVQVGEGEITIHGRSEPE